MKIFISIPECSWKSTFLTPRIMEKLKSFGEVVENPYDRNLTAEEMVEFAKDAEIIVTGWGTPCFEKKYVEQMPKLRLIAHSAGSVASLVAPEIYEMGILVASGNDVFAKSVAEGCLCYTLAALRRLEHYIGVMRDGGWKETVFQNRGLFGKKIGLVGFGTIAKHFANLIRWFNCEILIYSSHLSNEEAATYGARTASLEEIFSECDVISIHASKTPKTQGMITRALMERMKPDALLVNTARGAVVDEPALFEMLLAGKFYAALDVYDVEPPLEDDPIRKCKNVLLMPHMGGPTIDMREVVMVELCKDFERLQKGEPLVNQIDAAVAMRMTR